MRRRAALPPLPARPFDAHKASVGRVLVVGGSRGMAGAPVLAARGALRAGAGLVTVAVPRAIQDVVAGLLPEATTLGLPDLGGSLAASAAGALDAAYERADAVVVGPGASRSRGAVLAVRRVAATCPVALVLDADGLFAFARRLGDLARRRAPTVVTPHEGEAERLLAPFRGDLPRRARAEEIARAVGGVCVLKGPGTVVSDGGRTATNGTGGPILATGGSGDVLAGAVAAFVAAAVRAGGDVLDAVRLAVHAHGGAGDLLAARLGDRGALASEVADALPAAIRALVRAGRP